MKIYSIKARILIPLTLAMMILLFAFSISFYRFEQARLNEDVAIKFKSLEDIFFVHLYSDTNMMWAALNTIIRDKEIKHAFKARDRKTLLELTSGMFERLQSEHLITHFYFTDEKRVNILRVHKPDNHGDEINRFTTLMAEKSGKYSHGIELDELGIFTLRIVYPWKEGERLIGFVELGEEIEHIIDKLHLILGVDIILVIRKKYLDRENWEKGMKMLGREAEWDRFPTVAVISQTSSVFPDGIVQMLSGENPSAMLSDSNFSFHDRHYYSRAIPLNDAGQRFVGIMVILHDVTGLISDLKFNIILIASVCLAVGALLFMLFSVFLGRVEKQIAKSNRELIRISKAVESASDAILLTDTAGISVFHNMAFLDLFGYDVDELNTVGGHGRLYADPADAQNILHNIVTGKSFIGETEMRSRNGDNIHVSVRADSIRDDAGRIIGLVTIYTDISERKRAEEALRDSEERFRAMAATAKDAIVIADNHGILTYWNPAAQEIFGYTAQETVGKNLQDFLNPERYQKAAEKIFALFMESGKAPAVGQVFELEAKKKNGTETPVELSLSAFQLKGQWHAVGIMRDITERKRIQDELERLSYLDGLTGVANRRYFDMIFDQEWKRAVRDGRPLSLILCDIDYFKIYNDICGHQKGDDILKQVAATLEGSIKRAGDLVARYGGEEFVIILPDTDPQGAIEVAQELRANVGRLGIAHPGSQACELLSLSLGVATTVPEHVWLSSDLISAADQALYAAKENGRNRVCVSDFEMYKKKQRQAGQKPTAA